jgi:hypothetical protein
VTGEAKTGARIRPIGGSGIVNAGAGSEKVRAAGGKGFAMLGNTGSSGRSQVARVPSSSGPWNWYGAHGQDGVCWPSEPRWGLVDYPSYGFPSGGSEVPRVLHGIPLYDVSQWYLSPAVSGTIEDWLPDDLAYPWGPVGIADPEWRLAVMIAQESKGDVYVTAVAFLSEGPPDYNDVSGSAWFGLYRNSLLIASITTTSTLSGTLIYHGSMNAGDRFHIVYQTDVAPPGGCSQGAAWSLWVP